MKPKQLTGIFIIIIIAAGLFWILSKNDDFKNAGKEFMKNQILGNTEEIAEFRESLDFYVLADGTESRYLNYAIPELDTAFISNLIKHMYKNNGGKFWLSYIDRNSKNNDVLYFRVEPNVIHAKPTREKGETSFSYSQRLKAWNGKTNSFIKDSLNRSQIHYSEKREFLNSCNQMLKKVYSKGSQDNQWSDVTGSLNTAIGTLRQVQNRGDRKFIICFSDLQQDSPSIEPAIKLLDIPEDVKIVSVNPSIGSSVKVTEKVIEVEHPDRIIEICFDKN